MSSHHPAAPARPAPPSQHRTAPSKSASSHRAIGYARVSTVAQGRSGLGLEAQEASICAVCVSEGWSLAAVFHDVESGSNDAREGLQGAMDTLHRGDTLVVYDQSRLGRRFASLALIEKLEDRGVRVYLSGSRRFASVDLLTAIDGGMAVEERRKIRERTRAALGAKRARGEWVGRIPFGFRVSDTGQLEEDPTAMTVRRRALRLRRRGMSVRQVAEILSVPKSTVHDALRVNLRSLKLRYGACLQSPAVRQGVVCRTIAMKRLGGCGTLSFLT